MSDNYYHFWTLFVTRTSYQVWGQFGLDPSIGSCTILQDHKKRWINQPRKILNPPNNPGRLKSFSLSLPSLPLALQSWSATPGFSKFHLQLKTGFRTFSCKLQQIAIPTYWWSSIANPFLSPSGDLGIGLVWDNPTGPHRTTFRSDCWNPLQSELNHLWGVLSCSQDDIRWF